MMTPFEAVMLVMANCCLVVGIVIAYDTYYRRRTGWLAWMEDGLGRWNYASQAMTGGVKSMTNLIESCDQLLDAVTDLDRTVKVFPERLDWDPREERKQQEKRRQELRTRCEQRAKRRQVSASLVGTGITALVNLWKELQQTRQRSNQTRSEMIQTVVKSAGPFLERLGKAVFPPPLDSPTHGKRTPEQAEADRVAERERDRAAFVQRNKTAASRVASVASAASATRAKRTAAQPSLDPVPEIPSLHTPVVDRKQPHPQQQQQQKQQQQQQQQKQQSCAYCCTHYSCGTNTEHVGCSADNSGWEQMVSELNSIRRILESAKVMGPEDDNVTSFSSVRRDTRQQQKEKEEKVPPLPSTASATDAGSTAASTTSTAATIVGEAYAAPSTTTSTKWSSVSNSDAGISIRSPPDL